MRLCCRHEGSEKDRSRLWDGPLGDRAVGMWSKVDVKTGGLTGLESTANPCGVSVMLAGHGQHMADVD
ncbi:hypothetical protein PAAG_12138 [Paracoccidioides lutzii Pb01]|uniref:Uncharacterized protein n=1 Tax=Paracoccidioides lutzii (strain ATCC MYA-826 / Pb01) TaxID=502779 RepID=A0A0A2V151_PARBA|nr:hypothetical protein PAAG_12138 [Paracoccidioides lutzii Pb01]KGQ01193.1 hypothetical protein PAAG_12138 [Paracoccidioides lutzii Pb01]